MNESHNECLAGSGTAMAGKTSGTQAEQRGERSCAGGNRQKTLALTLMFPLK